MNVTLLFTLLYLFFINTMKITSNLICSEYKCVTLNDFIHNYYTTLKSVHCHLRLIHTCHALPIPFPCHFVPLRV
jgi:hypothetical protein